jgi:hypothetical protein
MAPSWRLRRDHVEYGQVNATGYVGPFYPKITVFYVLGHKGVLIFWSFTWAYK